MAAEDKESGPRAAETAGLDFVREIVARDLESGKNGRRVCTRFPPEPNGYLHIGHAKSICLNFGVAGQFGGVCHLRFDDTNPTKEDEEYVESIKNDVRWLGFDWNDKLFHASDYFEALYGFAVELVQKGKAYVDDLTADQIRDLRGTLTEPGKESPFRNRPVEESLRLLAEMRAGKHPDGSRVLRAKIDMASGNLVMRDPTLYRIRHVEHQRTGKAWCIYPMYDFAHCLSDSVERITHSICTLEFQNNRPLYDWILDQLDVPCHPQQIEFARLNLTYTVMSKRKLLELVEKGLVSGWDDPRMPTLCGMRRRGYTPESIRKFCETIGVSKKEGTIDMTVLEDCVRNDLNLRVPRVMAVLRPLKVVIENYPDGKSEELEAPFFPDDPARMGTRKIPFSRVIYIERDDFLEDPPPKYFRLGPGREVRLRGGYFIKCTALVRDPRTDEVVELRAQYDPATRSGQAPDGRKVKGTIHWVSAAHAIKATVRLYDRLFSVEKPDDPAGGGDYKANLNPRSLETIPEALIEPSIQGAAPGACYQFERQGYFTIDTADSVSGVPVFNRTVTLRDSWAKIAQGGKKPGA